MKRQGVINRIEKEMRFYERGIARNSHTSYYKTAGLLIDLAHETQDESHAIKALKCYNAAIEGAAQAADDNKMALYLAKRSKVYVDSGEKDLAVQDIKRASALPQGDDIIDMSTQNTIQGVIKNLMPQVEYEAAVAAGDSTQTIIAKLEKIVAQHEKQEEAATAVDRISPEVLSAAAGIGATVSRAVAAQETAAVLPHAHNGSKPAGALSRQG